MCVCVLLLVCESSQLVKAPLEEHRFTRRSVELVVVDSSRVEFEVFVFVVVVAAFAEIFGAK